MNLRYVGKDGSMGLKHGEIYSVRIDSLPSDEFIHVSWPVALFKTKQCPYDSPAAFAANWEKVKVNGR